MVPSRCVSQWTVEDVYSWVQERYPFKLSALHKAVIKHDLSGRALLRLRQHHLERLGVKPEERKEFLQDVLLLRIHEELENLNHIFSECHTS